MALRGIQERYGYATSFTRRRHVYLWVFSQILRSPEYSLRDVTYFLRNIFGTTPSLDDDVAGYDGHRYGTHFPMPVFLLLGRHDWQTPSTLAAEWLDTLRAPHKQVVWFEHSAHSPVTDEPDRFAEVLRTVVRPAVLDQPTAAVALP